MSFETFSPNPAAQRTSAVLIGGESVGKSQLLASLTGVATYVSNFRGSTLSCEVVDHAGFEFVDTPGIILDSDTETTRIALRQLEARDVVLLVVSAARMNEDLAKLIPIVRGRAGALVVSHWDKIIEPEVQQSLLKSVSRKLGVPVYGVDARHLNDKDKSRLLAALRKPGCFKNNTDVVQLKLSAPAARSIFENPLVAVASLFAPSFAAVQFANAVAGRAELLLGNLETTAHASFASSPSLLQSLMIGNYGLLTMFPLLFIWALPTVVMFALLLGAMKASGILDRVSIGVHPLVRHFGLGGRDVVRIVMGLGCNVPAVISTRGCSDCSRNTCISSIAFGSACSYQLGATLAVFAASGFGYLVLPYILILLVSTLIYARIISSPAARSAANDLLGSSIPAYLNVPSPQAVWFESRMTILHFIKRALPIFTMITLTAAALDWAGAIEAIASSLNWFAVIFGLPGEAITPIIMASIRKDGILLFAQPEFVATFTADQMLVATFLAGILTPCLVTTWTIAQERGASLAGKILLQQATGAIAATAVLALILKAT